MSSSTYITLGLVFVGGAILLGIGSIIVQASYSWNIRMPRIRIPKITVPRIRIPRIRLPRIRLPRIRLPRVRLPQLRRPKASAQPALSWTRGLIDSDQALDVVTRLDMIDRLAMLGQSWCVETLREAEREETDPRVAHAISEALESLTTGFLMR